LEHNVITERDAAPAAAVPEGMGAGDAAPAATTKDDAADRLFKYIPSITIGTYLALQGVVVEIKDVDTRKWVLLVISLVLLAGTYLYLRQRNVRRTAQVAASLGAFVIWIFTLGGPFDAFWDGWEQWMGSIALFLGAFLLVAWNPPPLPAED
jgi:hypothetical protein